MEISICGQIITLGDGIVNYIVLSKKYREFAKNTAHKYIEKFFYSEDLEKCFSETIDYSLERLKEDGVMDVTKEDISLLVDKNGYKKIWELEYYKYRNEYEKITQNTENEIKQVEMDYQNRARVTPTVDNNSTFIGTMGAMFTADVMNSFSDIAAANGVTTEKERLKNKDGEKKVTHFRNKKDDLYNALYQSLYSFHKAIIEIEGPNRFEVIDLQKKNRAAAIIEDIKNGKVREEDVPRMYVNCIMLDPENLESYYGLIDLDDEICEDVVKATNAIGLGDKISAYVLLKNEDEIVERLIHINFENLKEFDRDRAEFISWIKDKQLDPGEIDEALKMYRGLLEEYEKYVDGYIYDSIEEATNERLIVKQLVNRVSQIDSADLKAIEDVIGWLNNSELKSKEKYVNYLIWKAKDAEKKYTTVRGVTLDSMEKAEKARNEISLMDELLSKEVVDSYSIEKIKEFIHNTIQTEEFKKYYNKYIELCERAFEWIEEGLSVMSNNDYDKRSTFSDAFYTQNANHDMTRFLHITNNEYEAAFGLMRKQYTTINGKEFEDYDNADKQYYKCLDKAKAYLNYITEKNNNNKSFWGKLKTGLSSVVYENYISDYNFITKEGKLAIPNEDASGLSIVIDIHKRRDEVVNTFKTENMFVSKVIYGNECADTYKLSLSDVVDFDYPKRIYPRIPILNTFYKRWNSFRDEKRKNEIKSGTVDTMKWLSYDKSDKLWSLNLKSIGNNEDIIIKIICIYTGKEFEEVKRIIKKTPVKVIEHNEYFAKLVDLCDDIKMAGGTADYELESV